MGRRYKLFCLSLVREEYPTLLSQTNAEHQMGSRVPGDASVTPALTSVARSLAHARLATLRQQKVSRRCRWGVAGPPPSLPPTLFFE